MSKFPNDSHVRFARSGLPGREKPVALWEGRWWDVSSQVEDFTSQTIAPQTLAGLVDWVRAENLAETGAPQRLGPVISSVGSLVCIGQNYAAHAAESGSRAPEVPIVFFKHHSAVSGPNDDVEIPLGAEKVDWEVELAVVIGEPLYRCGSPEEALAAVAGYTISNDVSERYFQIEKSGGQWSKGKSFPGFNPLGPFLVPPGELGDPQALSLKSWVNDELRQDSSTSDMIFSIADLLVDLSNVMRLVPGDVVNTGTPQGVAFSGHFDYLAPGDRVRLAIEGLGEQEQLLVGTK